MNQIELYKKIDKFFSSGVENGKKTLACDLISLNIESKDYFFSNAPINWLSWLFENGFFDFLKVSSNNTNKYLFKIPELSFLLRVVESNGDEEKVVEIMNSVDCVKNVNTEVVEQFLWITRKFSMKSLISIIPKIQKENWVKLLKNSKLISGFTYEPIVKKLIEAKDYISILQLAEVLLTIDLKKNDKIFFDYYFALDEVGYSGIFEALADLDTSNSEAGIKLLLDLLTQLVNVKAKEDTGPFTFDTKFSLYDTDLFKISINKVRGSDDREDLKALIATLITLITRKFENNCQEEARTFFYKYFSTLPDAENFWRLKIFVMHYCPKLFEKELKTEISRFLKNKDYSSFLCGTPEFYKTLKLVFPTWTEFEKRDFFKKVYKYFEDLIKNTFIDEEQIRWHKTYTWRVLSSIESQLTNEEKELSKQLCGKKLDPNYKPTPSINSDYSFARGIRNLSPVKFSDEKYKDISVLIKELKEELSPEKLKEKYNDDNFLNPRNIEGVAKELKEDIQKRIEDYLLNALKFLDPALNIHYTYSFLQGVEDYLRAKNKLSKESWDSLFQMFEKIRSINKNDYKENVDNEDKWLARWPWVEKTMAEILKYFLTKDYIDLFKDKRDFVLSLITYLLESDNPKPEYETDQHGDLFSVAINSVRGVSFESFVNFVYQDGVKLKADVLDLYKKTIKNSSISVRFIIGHHLATFYYRDKEKIEELFKEIFPRHATPSSDFFAAWEGYVSNTLYKEMFESLNEYYDYALSINPALYPDRKKVRDFDEAIATHLALAFAHFDEVQYNQKDKYPLLEKLWKGNDTKKQKEFISFLGRGIISHGHASAEWFKEQNVKLEKLKDFWLLILDREDLDPEVYSAFGFWVNHQKDIFDYSWLVGMVAKTLVKSNGKINWDHGIISRLNNFVDVDPSNTFIIVKKYLLDGLYSENSNNRWFYLDDEKIKVFKKLYKAKPTETEELINSLLGKGGSTFWPLKDIVD